MVSVSQTFCFFSFFFKLEFFLSQIDSVQAVHVNTEMTQSKVNLEVESREERTNRSWGSELTPDKTTKKAESVFGALGSAQFPLFPSFPFAYQSAFLTLPFLANPVLRLCRAEEQRALGGVISQI